MSIFKFLGIAISVVTVAIVGKSVVVANSSELRAKQIQNSANRGFQFKERVVGLQDLKDEQKSIWSLNVESINGKDGTFSIGEVLKIIPERVGYSMGSFIYYIRNEMAERNV